jgi:hypothetical protein
VLMAPSRRALGGSGHRGQDGLVVDHLTFLEMLHPSHRRSLPGTYLFAGRLAHASGYAARTRCPPAKLRSCGRRQHPRCPASSASLTVFLLDRIQSVRALTDC